MQKTHKYTSTLFGLTLISLAIVTFLKIHEFIEEKSILAAIFIGISALYTIRYFTSQQINIKDSECNSVNILIISKN